MKLTGPACTEALSGAEEDGTRERAEDNAGGVRVELGVRPQGQEWKKFALGIEQILKLNNAPLSHGEH